MSWIVGILALGFLIVVHEFGHYVVARWCKMDVARFSIGFGPALLKRRSKKTGTLFQIAPIPFGGFVEIKGMNVVEDVDPEDTRAYPNRPAWQRFVTIFAGPGTNYVSAILLAFGLYTCHGMPSAERYYGVSSVREGYDAVGKLKQGDRIVSVDGVTPYLVAPNGKPLRIATILAPKKGAPATVVVRRDGKELSIQMVPKLDPENKDEAGNAQYSLGFTPFLDGDTMHVGIATAAESALVYPVIQTEAILGMFRDIFTGKEKAEVHSGLGVIAAAKDAWDQGLATFIGLVMMLSVYLGLFNLFPLPALDGGRLVFLTYELATRRRANPRVESTVHLVGIVLLGLVMVFALFKDCAHFVGK